METIEIERLKKSKYHSSDGPLKILEGNRCPLTDALVEAVQNQGYKWMDDINGVEDLDGKRSLLLFSDCFKMAIDFRIWKCTNCTW
jgi:hypothetical protein